MSSQGAQVAQQAQKQVVAQASQQGAPKGGNKYRNVATSNNAILKNLFSGGKISNNRFNKYKNRFNEETKRTLAQTTNVPNKFNIFGFTNTRMFENGRFTTPNSIITASSLNNNSTSETIAKPFKLAATKAAVLATGVKAIPNLTTNKGVNVLEKLSSALVALSNGLESQYFEETKNQLKNKSPHDGFFVRIFGNYGNFGNEQKKKTMENGIARVKEWMAKNKSITPVNGGYKRIDILKKLLSIINKYLEAIHAEYKNKHNTVITIKKQRNALKRFIEKEYENTAKKVGNALEFNRLIINAVNALTNALNAYNPLSVPNGAQKQGAQQVAPQTQVAPQQRKQVAQITQTAQGGQQAQTGANKNKIAQQQRQKVAQTAQTGANKNQIAQQQMSGNDNQ